MECIPSNFHGLQYEIDTIFSASDPDGDLNAASGDNDMTVKVDFTRYSSDEKKYIKNVNVQKFLMRKNVASSGWFKVNQNPDPVPATVWRMKGYNIPNLTSCMSIMATYTVEFRDLQL